MKQATTYHQERLEYYKKRKLQSSFPYEQSCKIHQNFCKSNPAICKTLIHHDQEGCAPGIQVCFIFENQSIHHIKRKKNYIIIKIDAKTKKDLIKFNSS